MEKDIKENPLWVIKSTDQKNGTGGTELRIVQWIVNGKPGNPMLEKRDYFFNEAGERKAGKAKGFTGFDLITVLESVHKIGEMLKIPKAKLAEQLVASTMGNEPPPGRSSATPASKSPAGSSSGITPAAAIPAATGPAGSVPDVEF